ncbi:MAG: hypothetical protein ACJAW8_002679, partial [Oleispira sp.]
RDFLVKQDFRPSIKAERAFDPIKPG